MLFWSRTAGHDKHHKLSRLERFGRSQYSSKEQEAIERALKARLGPNFISKRPVGGGSHAAYLEGHTAVSLANEIFGFNGWSRSVTEETIDFVDHKEDKYFIGISAMVDLGKETHITTTGRVVYCRQRELRQYVGIEMYQTLLLLT